MIDYNYPTAFLGEAVQKNLLITDGTVTVSGDTYTVTGDTVTITNSELETEAFELHQSLCSDMQLRFGSCESASISFVFHGSIGTIKGKTVKVYIIPNHEASKILQLGVFKIYEDNKVGDDLTKRRVVGYDAMYEILNSDVAEWYYETIFPTETATKTVKQIRESLLTHFNITAETVTLINDNVLVKRKIDSDMISGGDIIKAICEINGVFGMITNEGKFRFFSLDPDFDNDTDIDTPQLIDCQYESYYSEPITTLKIISDSGASITRGETSDPRKNTYVISGNILINSLSGSALDKLSAANRLWHKLEGHMYVPATVSAIGNPVHEVGDPVRVWPRGNRQIITYILERQMRGIQALRDTYTSRGEEYFNARLNSSSSRYSQISNEIAQATQAASVTADNDFVEIIRNIGFRLLDEPSNVNVNFDKDIGEVRLKWTDPADITTLEPVPCEWAGTIVVRKEGSAPRHRWDGVLITDSTTRDQYASNPLVDNTINISKQYYYGIFPYHIWLNDTANPIKHYRYTKCVKINGIDAGEEIVIFENGLFNTSVMADDFDLSNYKSSDISDYYLTKWVLYFGLNSNWRPLQLDNGMIKAEYRSGWSNCDCYLPIKRNANMSKIIARAKFTRLAERDQDFNQLQLNIGKVENNTLIIQRSEVYSRFTEWTNIEIETNNFGDIDYIGFLYYDGEFVIDKVSYISR